MEYSEISINHLFKGQPIPGYQIPGIENHEKIQQMKKEAKQKEPGLIWEKLIDEAIKLSSGLLDIKLKDILEGAWKKYNAVMDYLDKEKYPSGETFLIPLLEHTVKSEHHPKIEVLINKVKLGDINFELLLNLKLKGIILRIKNGEIEGVKTGSCMATGSFSCEGIRIYEESTQEFIL